MVYRTCPVCGNSVNEHKKDCYFVKDENKELNDNLYLNNAYFHVTANSIARNILDGMTDYAMIRDAVEYGIQLAKDMKDNPETRELY